jgi:hypothetical protein
VQRQAEAGQRLLRAQQADLDERADPAPCVVRAGSMVVGDVSGEGFEAELEARLLWKR